MTSSDNLHNDEGEEIYRESSKPLLSLKKTFWRWIQLILIIIFFLTNYLGYAIFPSLQTQIMNSLKIQEKGFNILMSSYSLPNIINPLFAGILIDRCGNRIGIIFYTTLMVIGLFIQYMAALNDSYYLMLGGVLSFGLGSEAMCIIISAFASSWFMGKELSLGLGATTASANLGSVLANWVLPPMYNINNTIVLPFLICFIGQCVGYISAFVMCGIDKAADNQEAKIKKRQYQESSNSVERNLLQDSAQIDLHEEEEAKDKIQCSDFKKLTGIMFWGINFVYCFQCASLIPFQNNLQNILIKFYGQNEVPAGRILSLITIQTALLTPIFAHITDKIGKRAQIFIISAVINVLTFIMWLLLPTCDDGGCYWFYLPIIVNGFGASLFSAVVYPSIPLVVDHKVLGTAFGIQDCAQQFGMALVPLVIGPIMQHGNEIGTYKYAYLFFLGTSILGLLGGIFIYIYDLKHGNKLNAKEGEYDQIKGKISKCSMRKTMSFARR